MSYLVKVVTTTCKLILGATKNKMFANETEGRGSTSAASVGSFSCGVQKIHCPWLLETKNAADLRLHANASALRSSHIADWMRAKVYNEAIIVVICKCVGLLNDADNSCCKWIFNRNRARLIYWYYFTFSALLVVPCCSRSQWVTW